MTISAHLDAAVTAGYGVGYRRPRRPTTGTRWLPPPLWPTDGVASVAGPRTARHLPVWAASGSDRGWSMSDLGDLIGCLVKELVGEVGEGTGRRDLLTDARLGLVSGVPLRVPAAPQLHTIR